MCKDPIMTFSWWQGVMMIRIIKILCFVIFNSLLQVNKFNQTSLNHTELVCLTGLLVVVVTFFVSDAALF